MEIKESGVEWEWHGESGQDDGRSKQCLSARSQYLYLLP